MQKHSCTLLYTSVCVWRSRAFFNPLSIQVLMEMLSYHRQCPEVEFQRLRNLDPPDKHQYPIQRLGNSLGSCTERCYAYFYCIHAYTIQVPQEAL